MERISILDGLCLRLRGHWNPHRLALNNIKKESPVSARWTPVIPFTADTNFLFPIYQYLSVAQLTDNLHANKMIGQKFPFHTEFMNDGK